MKKLRDQYLTFIVATVTTGRLYTFVNVGLWHVGLGERVPDLTVVHRSREGPRRWALQPLGLLPLLLLLLTHFLSEEKTREPRFQKLRPGLF